MTATTSSTVSERVGSLVRTVSRARAWRISAGRLGRLGWKVTRPSIESLVSFVCVGAVSLFVFIQLSPSLLFTDTTATGGDMGSHVWGPAYLRDHLLGHGRLAGWAPDWYAGFPALTFYFPLPTLLIVLLDVLLPYNVAFKLVTVLGLVSLPVCAWAFAKLTKIRFPGPPLFAVATLPFLFDRFHVIYGGNVAATLAGEFSFSISLSLALLFLGVFVHSVDTGRHRATAALLLAATGLCHLVPTLFAIVGATVFVLLRFSWARVRSAFPVMIVGGLLSAFWSIPFLFRLGYTNDMGYEKFTDYGTRLFPFLDSTVFKPKETWHLVIVVALAGMGAVLSLARRFGLRVTRVTTAAGPAAATEGGRASRLGGAGRASATADPAGDPGKVSDRTGLALTVLTAVAAFGVVFAPQGKLWNARLLPLWFLCLYLLAAYAVSEMARMAAAWAASDEVSTAASREWAVPKVVVPVVALVLALRLVGLPLGVLPDWVGRTADQSFVPPWAEWNYSGVERKTAYPEHRAIVDTMDRLGRDRGCGRAHWEYEAGRLGGYGTPMALMMLPYWTKGCIASMEGLYFESAATTPFHFLNAGELSKAPSNPQRNLPYSSPSPNLEAGIRHLQVLGVRYYMAVSPEAITAANQHPDLTKVATSGPWNVFEVSGSELVVGLDQRPVVMNGVEGQGHDWLEAAVAAYQDAGKGGPPFAVAGPRDWPRAKVTRGSSTSEVIGSGVRIEAPTSPKMTPARVSRVRTSDDRISFEVDQPGKPVLVKASYFPNWKATGAQGPWRVTPNLMVVVPTEREVSLRYAWTPVELGGYALTALGVAGVVALYRRRPKQASDLRDAAEADVGPDPATDEGSAAVDESAAGDGTPTAGPPAHADCDGDVRNGVKQDDAEMTGSGHPASTSP